MTAGDPWAVAPVAYAAQTRVRFHRGIASALAPFAAHSQGAAQDSSVAGLWSYETLTAARGRRRV